MTEPTERDREMAQQIVADMFAHNGDSREAHIDAVIPYIIAARAVSRLPPLFEPDDWLWVAQSLGYVPFSVDDAGFAERHRMDQIIAKILEYRAEDVRRGGGE